MSEKTEKDAAGKALYMEFRKENYTYQVIVTPALVSLDKSFVHKPYQMARRITSWHPRKNWAFNAGDIPAALTRDADGNFESKTDDERNAIIGEQASTSHLRYLMDNMFARGYTLFKQPIFVEVAFKDLDMMKNGNTPQDLVRRIVRSREGFGFPTELFTEPVAV
jgi:hypothetical protein